jgi:hypothetical protein
LIRNPYAREILVGEVGTPIRLDLAVPPQVLEGLRFCPPGGRERGLRHIEHGKLARPDSLLGVYRLTPGSAWALDALLDSSAEREEVRGRDSGAGTAAMSSGNCLQS